MYLFHQDLLLPRLDSTGSPTNDNHWHTMPTLNGSRSVQGFMGDDDFQGQFFYNLGYFTRGIAVELGSFHGLSAVLFGLGMRDSPWQEGQLICVDWFGDGFTPDGDDNLLGRFADNINAFNVQHHITAIKGSCEDPKLVKEKGLEWVYFDASHFAKELRVNLEIYYPKIKDGGLLLFHDTHMPEVVLCIEEYKESHGLKPVITNRPDFQVWQKPSK